jgi:hypothetical protein
LDALLQEEVVKCLLKAPGLELDAINIRGQTAEEVAQNRYNIWHRNRKPHDHATQLIYLLYNKLSIV